ncbi:hypothetical protein [Bacillus phage BillyBob]|nr:hypothetical protein [Bacillus phage BillyBob]
MTKASETLELLRRSRLLEIENEFDKDGELGITIEDIGYNESVTVYLDKHDLETVYIHLGQVLGK